MEQKKEVQHSLIESQEFCMTLETKAHQSSVNSLELLTALRECEAELDALKIKFKDFYPPIVAYIP